MTKAFEILTSGMSNCSALHIYQVWCWQLKPFSFYSMDTHTETQKSHRCHWSHYPCISYCQHG